MKQELVILTKTVKCKEIKNCTVKSLIIVQITTTTHVQATVDHRTNKRLSKIRAINISKSLVQIMGQQIMPSPDFPIASLTLENQQ